MPIKLNFTPLFVILSSKKKKAQKKKFELKSKEKEKKKLQHSKPTLGKKSPTSILKKLTPNRFLNQNN